MAADVLGMLMQENKKTGFQSLGAAFSDDDVVRIWEGVAGFIEKNMQNQKGVNVPNLGTFTFVQRKLDVGGNKFVLIQRPVFQIGEKFCQNHGLKQTKYFLTGSVPVVPLNYSALSIESPYARDQVESCVREMIGSLNRSVAAQRTVEIAFTGLGRLQIRDNTVKFRFYKEFVNSVDQSGRAMNLMQNRPGTADSVMTDRPTSRAFSVCLPLPKISEGSQTGQLVAIPEDEGAEIDFGRENQAVADYWEQELQHLTDETGGDKAESEGKQTSRIATSRTSSRLSAPVAMATDVSLGDLVPTSSRLQRITPPTPTRQLQESVARTDSQLQEQFAECTHTMDPVTHQFTSDSPIQAGHPQHSTHPLDTELQRLEDRLATGFMADTPQSSAAQTQRSQLTPPKPPSISATPSRATSACGHPSSAGQELCYLCHQRSMKNQPISFAEEIARKEEEEDRLLQAYQQMRDTEHLVNEQENLLAKRHDFQKASAFNLGVAEAVRQKKQYRDPNFYRSYIFQHRPLTPSRTIKQNKMSNELGKQVDEKKSTLEKLRADEAFLERLEQVQLAEDLAAQRDQYMKERSAQQDMYRRALSAQMRYKPVPLPERVPDSSEPVFGKNDVSEQKLLEKRRRAQDVMEEQAEAVAQKKREAILARLQEQRYEEEVLKRTKDDLLKDRAARFRRHFENRKGLEDEWLRAAHDKKEKEVVDKMRCSTPGGLLHEQCDRYKRCSQCRRKLNNMGETNIWCESYYVPGSRYIC